jgi:hypothetical protein
MNCYYSVGRCTIAWRLLLVDVLLCSHNYWICEYEERGIPDGSSKSFSIFYLLV